MMTCHYPDHLGSVFWWLVEANLLVTCPIRNTTLIWVVTHKFVSKEFLCLLLIIIHVSFCGETNGGQLFCHKNSYGES